MKERRKDLVKMKQTVSLYTAIERSDLVETLRDEETLTAENVTVYFVS